MKSRPDFLPPNALLLAGTIMAMNEGKHPNQRWKTMTSQEHVGAALRHVLTWLSGELNDPETNKSHLAHGLCRLAMAVEQEQPHPAPAEPPGFWKRDKPFAGNSPNSLSTPMTPQEGDVVKDKFGRKAVVKNTYGRDKGIVTVQFYSDGYTLPSFIEDLTVVSRPEYEASLDGKLEECSVKKGKTIDEYTEQEWNETRL